MNDNRSGTQTIERTISILKIVVSRKEIGWRLMDLAARCELNITTTHRIVARLTAERLLRQRPQDRRYVPGPLLFELALGLPAYSALKEAMRPELMRIAKCFNGIAYLHLRAGDDVVCIDRVGYASAQPMTMVGTRAPIIESTFGIAMLLSMPREEQAALIKSAGRKSKRPADYRQIFSRVLRRSRRYGFGLNKGDVVPGLAGIAVPIHDNLRRPVAAIGIMGAMEDYRGAQLKAVVEGLRQDAKRIERTYSELLKEISV